MLNSQLIKDICKGLVFHTKMTIKAHGSVVCVPRSKLTNDIHQHLSPGILSLPNVCLPNPLTGYPRPWHPPVRRSAVVAKPLLIGSRHPAWLHLFVRSAASASCCTKLWNSLHSDWAGKPLHQTSTVNCVAFQPFSLHSVIRSTYFRLLLWCAW